MRKTVATPLPTSINRTATSQQKQQHMRRQQMTNSNGTEEKSPLIRLRCVRVRVYLCTFRVHVVCVRDVLSEMKLLDFLENGEWQAALYLHLQAVGMCRKIQSENMKCVSECVRSVGCG